MTESMSLNGAPLICLTINCMKTYYVGLDSFVVYLHRVGYDNKLNGWFYLTFLNNVGRVEGFMIAKDGLELKQDNEICDIIAAENGYFQN